MSAALDPARVAILMYHSIAASTTPSLRHLTVDPSQFDEQVAALRGAGARLVAVDDVPGILAAPRHIAGPPTVAITIDDGLADVATGALPVLARYEAPATLFVPTAFVGATARWLPGADGRRPMLGWPALSEIADAGVEIGSHGHRHLAGDVNDPDLIRADALRSRAELEDRLGREIRSFGFPFGYGPPEARTAVRRAGFAQACVAAGLPAQAGEDRFALPRLHVGPQTTPDALLSLIRHRPSSPARWRARAKQRVWTVGRRRLGWGPPEAGIETNPALATR
jgi:peptidoglycan/xylan/chitin deacetylase (PgdA/CDA1 family)